jgi:hypothetical protein
MGLFWFVISSDSEKSRSCAFHRDFSLSLEMTIPNLLLEDALSDISTSLRSYGYPSLSVLVFDKPVAFWQLYN